MQVSAISSGMAFRGSEEKPKGGGGKAVASVFIPGLGQFCDGRNKDGAKFLLGFIGLSIGSTVSGRLVRTAQSPAVRKAGLAGAVVSGLATSALWIYNIVDAYKGGKK
jgi:hypothetical protein